MFSLQKKKQSGRVEYARFGDGRRFFLLKKVTLNDLFFLNPIFPRLFCFFVFVFAPPPAPQLYNHVDDVEDIVEKSNKEAKIDAQLGKIRGVWKLLQLEFIGHKGGEVKLIRVPEDVNQVCVCGG